MVGDFDEPAIKAQVNKDFSKWNSKNRIQELKINILMFQKQNSTLKPQTKQMQFS